MKNIKTFRRIFLPACFVLFASIAFAQPNFVNKIPIPYQVDRATRFDTLKLVMHTAVHNFNPAGLSNPNDSLNHLPTFVYNQKDSVGRPGALTLLGPTLIWHTAPNIAQQDTIYISLKNNLPVNTTTHWHGAEIPAIMDGGPHQVINAGDTWYPKFENLDRTSTLWYHPHLHDTTVEQVTMGLSGLILSKDSPDPIGAVLPRTYGVDDIPLILGDMGVDSTGTHRFDHLVLQKGTRPTSFVNGVTNPYVEVPAAFVRLRILNGSSRKGIQFGFSNAYDRNGTIVFTLIATDGGYTITTDNISDTLHTLLTGPGSRNEVLLDLTGRQGTSIYLSNMNRLMPNSIVGSPYVPPTGGGLDTTRGNAFLRLDIKSPNSFPNYTPVTSIPNYTVDWEPNVRDTFGVNRRRLKNLILTPKPVPNPTGIENKFTIDGIEYNMLTINDTICLGAKEIWTINNKSGIAHPFHIHKVFFRVLDIDSLGTSISLHKYGLLGPKDDVMVLPNWKLRFLAVFDDFPTAISPHNCYMYHCHILTHEDAIGGGMMHQFVVTQDANCIPNQTTPPKEMGIFPNPFRSGELFLKGVSGGTSTLQIYDLLGQLIRKQELDPFWGNTLIDADGILPGLYIVKWNNSKGKFAGKLLITQ